MALKELSIGYGIPISRRWSGMASRNMMNALDMNHC